MSFGRNIQKALEQGLHISVFVQVCFFIIFSSFKPGHLCFFLTHSVVAGHGCKMQSASDTGASCHLSASLLCESVAKFGLSAQPHVSHKVPGHHWGLQTASTPPFIWFSCFSYLSSQNMEFLTASHSAVSNTLFIQTSFEDPLLSVSLPCPLAPIPNAP